MTAYALSKSTNVPICSGSFLSSLAPHPGEVPEAAKGNPMCVGRTYNG